MNDPERTATAIVDTAFRIHVRLGPGLLESVYEALLAYELRRRGHAVLRQKRFGFYYDDVLVKWGFTADLVVDGCVVVEVKAAESASPVAQKAAPHLSASARPPAGTRRELRPRHHEGRSDPGGEPT